MNATHWDCGQQCASCVSQVLWSRVAEDGDCWVYRGRMTKGYGRFRVSGREFYAHRVAYELLRAEIPEGLHIDHLCRNPACCNPWHLEPVPSAVNTLRGVGPTAAHSRLEACWAGHPYTAENTYVRRGFRDCRTCKRDRAAAWNEKRKELRACPDCGRPCPRGSLLAHRRRRHPHALAAAAQPGDGRTGE